MIVWLGCYPTTHLTAQVSQLAAMRKPRSQDLALNQHTLPLLSAHTMSTTPQEYSGHLAHRDKTWILCHCHDNCSHTYTYTGNRQSGLPITLSEWHAKEQPHESFNMYIPTHTDTTNGCACRAPFKLLHRYVHVWQY